MNIKHYPIFDTQKVIDFYSEKDGVPIKYVCTSALGDEAFARDIYFRETPHPQFGNRYFALFKGRDSIMIGNADSIEDVTFAMIEFEQSLYYSRHRHDYVALGESVVDGGRAYYRGRGPHKVLRVKDGEFVDG
jgi:hypothetical protein